MPIYEYFCDECKYNFEVVQRMSDDAFVDCPECGLSSLRRIFGVPFCLVYGEAKTIEHQAARNRKTIGADTIHERAAKKKEERAKAFERAKPPKGGQVLDPTKATRPWWRSGAHGCPNSEKPLDSKKFMQDSGEIKKDAVTQFIEKGI